jgi:hypothetical protein
MKKSSILVLSRRYAVVLLLACSFLFICGSLSHAQKPETQPVVVSARIENGALIYRVNGKKVEDSTNNSLLRNLGNISKQRGTHIPVFILIDVRAPFSEVGKLETALDKVDLTERRLFVSNFSDGTINEIHWDQKAIPIPRS